MQRNDPEKRVTLEARDLERPLSGGLTPIDAVIEVIKSDCPKEWARYCDLAHLLVQLKQPTEISKEEAGQKLLAANSKLLHRKDKSHLVRLFNNTIPLSESEILAAEAQTLEGQFRGRLLQALEDRRYHLQAFDDFQLLKIPPALIKPGHFRFESDEMEVNETKLFGVHFVRAQPVPASQTDSPGRKPGKKSVKNLACEIVLRILNDEAQRPPKRHGRQTALARLVQAVLEKEGKTYELNSIEKFIRGTVKEWEKKNLDQ